MSCCGWANYETWNIDMWYGHLFINVAADYLESADGDREHARVMLAQHIEDTIYGSTPDLGCGAYTALLRSALKEVDCWELAEVYIAEIQDAE